MIERLLIVLIVLLLTLGAVLLVRMLVRRRAMVAVGQPAPVALRLRLANAGPTVVYFYGPHCGTCGQQARALEELGREGATPVVRVDASQERELAKTLGVVTVPTTALVDAQGRVRRVNVGYQPKAALAGQLAGL